MSQSVELEGIPPAPSSEPFSVSLTEAAVKMAKVMRERQSLPNAGLRVTVSGGGCSGMKYGLSFDDQIGPDDTVIEQEGVRLMIDAASRPYLNGLTIDYVHALHGAGFKFLNPQAERTCGCGSSFAL